MKERLLERFLRYTRFHTTSAYGSSTYPSTECQWTMLRALVEELREIGCAEVEIDSYGYVMSTIPASMGCEAEPTIGFLAHVDTSPDASGRNVRAQVVENFDPSRPLPLAHSGLTLDRAEFTELDFFAGHTIITTDGTTLLGADDKAGAAAILTAAEYLIANPQIRHGRIRLGFTPDEEIGRGVDHFDVERFGADFAYTIDSGGEGCLEYENFNAARVELRASGRNIHPGYAKGKMVNALQLLIELHNTLPATDRPELTENREGFFHLIKLGGTVEEATAQYIIRDHHDAKFAERKALMAASAERMGVEVEIRDEYRNMRSQIEPRMEIVERAIRAIRKAGAKEIITPIRGGTDGARLSYMGLPCPNIFTGGMNPHSIYEYASLDSMLKAAKTVVNIAQID